MECIYGIVSHKKLGIRLFEFQKSFSAMNFFDLFFALNLNLAESKNFRPIFICSISIDKRYFGDSAVFLQLLL